jgi:hypothetical protein
MAVRYRPIVWSATILLIVAWIASPVRAALVEWAKPSTTTTTTTVITITPKTPGTHHDGTPPPAPQGNPEPASMISALSGVGLLGFVAWLRRRRRGGALTVDQLEETPPETDEEPFST